MRMRRYAASIEAAGFDPGHPSNLLGASKKAGCGPPFLSPREESHGQSRCSHTIAIAAALLPAVEDVLGDAVDERTLAAWGEALLVSRRHPQGP
ncbi:hypothetical protein [Hydrocarboniphaga effusa]|uniref:hypothetical protein n=1 Tax=Hydrocarboniphaga effusa TaxID=243629 RepID=UPI00398C1A7D